MIKTKEVMKMNNKGMTLVELIVTFSLLMIVVIGMFNLIMDVKGNLDDKKMVKELIEYSSTVGHQIQYDFIKNDVITIAYKEDNDAGWQVQRLAKENGNYKVEGITLTSGTAQFDEDGYDKFKLDKTDLDKKCQSIFPCVVYSYKTGESVELKTIAINIPETIKPSGTPKEKLGIYYNDVFEALPYQENVNMRLAVSSDENGSNYINYDDDTSVFSINVPIKIVDQEGNYGFKVVRILKKQEAK